jgi:hypothetical protein
MLLGVGDLVKQDRCWVQAIVDARLHGTLHESSRSDAR